MYASYNGREKLKCLRVLFDCSCFYSVFSQNQSNGTFSLFHLAFILISAKNRGDQEIVVGSLIVCVLKYDSLWSWILIVFFYTIVKIMEVGFIIPFIIIFFLFSFSWFKNVRSETAFGYHDFSAQSSFAPSNPFVIPKPFWYLNYNHWLQFM